MKKYFQQFTLFAFCFILFTSALHAQTAAPPEKNKREAHLVELNTLDETIKLDIRYATENNFVGKIVYLEARAFLQKPAAAALLRVHKKLKKRGLGLVIFDGYRPWAITKLFWEVTPEEKRKFVANPAKGSKHNRGCAVDLSIYDLKTGALLPMPSGFDEFSERASPDYTGGTVEERANRDLLRKLMEAEGFIVNANEWWHFDYKDWENYAIYDIVFSQIGDIGAKISEAVVEEKPDWKRFFDAAQVTGGIYVYDLRKNKFSVYDRERMNRGFVPASTSKIIHSLIFLDSGALKDENEVLKWDGVKRRVEAWNQDHNLRSAFKASAAWFYVEASKRVGREKIQKYYDESNYGNRNTDGFGKDYWVAGDLRITPKQQIDFLIRFYENRLPFSPRSVEVVKGILIDERTDKYILRAKTGWSDSYAPQIGWFVGYVEKGDEVYFFAAEIDIKKNEDAAKRREITRNVLKSLQIIE